MRLRIAALAAAALIGAAVSASEAEEPEKPCGSSTYEIVECQKAELAALDKRLNAAYRQALQDAQSAKQREQLRAAQRLWLKYRERIACITSWVRAPSPASTAASACST
jgi:uncharacterized protein YecT (DUF1311 family)